MNKAIERKIETIIELENKINNLNHDKDKLIKDIQELSNSKKGIEQKITMYTETLNKEYMNLKELMLGSTK